jgi:hypothetical protein
MALNKLQRASKLSQLRLCFLKASLQSMILKQFGTLDKTARQFDPHLCGDNVWFVDDVYHCTNDLAMYRAFHKRFEKRFDLKSEAYLGNRIQHDRVKGTVAVNQNTMSFHV